MENKEKSNKPKKSKKDKSKIQPNPNEITKMKQGMTYSCKEKTIILNVFKYFRTVLPDRCVTEIVRRTASATGCSEKSIFQFRKEEASAEGFKEPSKTKVRKNININSRDIKYDNTVRQAIRNIIYDLQYKNISPSLSTILKHVHADNQIPNFSLMTLRRLMFDMGFYYQKNGNKCILVDKPDSRFDDTPQSEPKSLGEGGNIENETNQSQIHPQQELQQQSLQLQQSHTSQPSLQILHQQQIVPMHHNIEPVANVPTQKTVPMVLSIQPNQQQHQTPVPVSRIMQTMHISHHHNSIRNGIHEQPLMGPPLHGPPPPSSIIHKTVPILIPSASKREPIMPHTILPPHHSSNIDMHVKREHFEPWMHSFMNKN